MEGKYLLRKDSKPNEFGEYKIALQYCTQGVPVKKSTGISIKPDLWLGDNGDNKYIRTGKDGHQKAYVLNQRLVNMKKGIDDRINSLLAEKNQIIPVPVLRSILSGEYDREKDRDKGQIPFVEFVLAENQGIYNLGKISYSVWSNIKCNMNTFCEFLHKVKHLDTSEKTTLYCRDITVKLFKDYIKYRQDRGNTNETINKALTPIIKAVKIMHRRDWISRDVCDEICNVYLPANAKVLGADTTTHYLTQEQVKQIIEAVKSAKYERTRDIFDMFMFSLHTCGLRFSDVATLRWAEIDMDKKTIKHIQVKNHTRNAKMLSLSIPNEGMKILERWQGRNDNFVFGLLDDEFDLTDRECLKETLNSKNRTINTSLKTLGDKIKLPFSLHFHCSRHTFATLALNNEVDVKTISTLMGHSSVLTTEKVYATLMPSTIEKTVEEKLNFHF